MENDVKVASEEVYNQLLEGGASADKLNISEIQTKLEALIAMYVPMDEAKKTVRGAVAKSLGIAPTRGGATKTVTMKEMPCEDGIFITVSGKITKIFDNNKESVLYSGYAADASGSKKFIIFKKNAPAGTPELEEGKSYEFKNVVTNVWEGNVSFKAVKTSIISECDGIETEPTITGVIVDVSDDSGLVKRCPMIVKNFRGEDAPCNKALTKGACTLHGKQPNATDDLRIKAVLDNGQSPVQLILNAAMVEAVTGMNLVTAKKMAMDAFDPQVVTDEINHLLMGKYFTAKGSVLKNLDESRKDVSIMVKSITLSGKVETDYAALRARIEALGGE